MSRPLTGPKCRLCRRERQKLFLKGDKCFTPKCPVQVRDYPPGIHGQSAFRISEYGRQLREKQKLRRSYGITEKQLSNIYKQASRLKGVTGTKMLEMLELRLDNVVYRAGLTDSRNQARQLVNHGHFLVNGRRLDVSSYVVKNNDVISIRPGSRNIDPLVPKKADKKSKDDGTQGKALKKEFPKWMKMDSKTKDITVVEAPDSEELERLGFNAQMIIEFYSR